MPIQCHLLYVIPFCYTIVKSNIDNGSNYNICLRYDWLDYRYCIYIQLGEQWDWCSAPHLHNAICAIPFKTLRNCFSPLLIYTWHICMHLCKCRKEFNKLKKCVSEWITWIFSWKSKAKQNNKKKCILWSCLTSDIYWCRGWYIR